MNEYLVGFNNDGTLITEQVSAADKEQAKAEAQPLHPDLPIIFVKYLKQGEQNERKHRTEHQSCNRITA